MHPCHLRRPSPPPHVFPFNFHRLLSRATFALVMLGFLRTSAVIYYVVGPNSIPLTGTFHGQQISHAVRLYSGMCSGYCSAGASRCFSPWGRAASVPLDIKLALKLNIRPSFFVLRPFCSYFRLLPFASDTLFVVCFPSTSD